MWKILISLTASMIIGSAVQAQPALAAEAGQPGTLLLAQRADQLEKQEAEAIRADQEKRLKEKHLQKEEGQMEKSKTRAIQEPPAASGTKRIGGQTIRDKETLEGD